MINIFDSSKITLVDHLKHMYELATGNLPWNEVHDAYIERKLQNLDKKEIQDAIDWLKENKFCVPSGLNYYNMVESLENM
jgi:hypothetical protein